MATASLNPATRASLVKELILLSASDKSNEELIIDIVRMVQQTSTIESVGLRLSDGTDYPYYFTSGFDDEFVQKEMHLCVRDEVNEIIRDSEGKPVLECMCGNIICGRVDAEYPFFSEGGSFWTNSTTELLASTTESDRQARTRNRCNGEGYESVALIPIKSERSIFGLLQLNDRKKEMFTDECISFYEGVCSIIGVLFSAIQKKKRLADTGRADEQSGFTVDRSMALEKIAVHIKV